MSFRTSKNCDNSFIMRVRVKEKEKNFPLEQFFCYAIISLSQFNIQFNTERHKNYIKILNKRKNVSKLYEILSYQFTFHNL